MTDFFTSLDSALARLEAMPNVTIASNGSFLNSDPDNGSAREDD